MMAIHDHTLCNQLFLMEMLAQEMRVVPKYYLNIPLYIFCLYKKKQMSARDAFLVPWNPESANLFPQVISSSFEFFNELSFAFMEKCRKKCRLFGVWAWGLSKSFCRSNVIQMVWYLLSQWVKLIRWYGTDLFWEEVLIHGIQSKKSFESRKEAVT